MTLRQTNLSWKAVAQAAVILISAASLKAFYSTASVNDLTWILGPTKTVVETICGVKFHFESYAGYMSEDRSFLIATACSGVNFLIAIFALLSFRLAWRRRSEGISWSSLLLIAGLSYIVTILANSLRISSAIWLNAKRPQILGLNREELHRLDGIVIYFGVILSVYIAFEYFERKRKTFTWKSLTFPLAIYYAITLAIPAANGAFRNHDFSAHSVFVLMTPLVITGIVMAIRKSLFRNTQNENVAPFAPRFPGDLGIDEICTGSNI